MFDLKCRRTGCEFNKNCNCTANEIEVKKNTICKTYSASKDENKRQEEKIGQPPIRKDIEVLCKAKCIFNSNYVCTANGITVQTDSSVNEPICCTFMPE